MSSSVATPSTSAADAPKHALNKRRIINACVIVLLVILYLQLTLTARIQSMTVDEGNHTYSGYMSWKRFDFGLNPEHPPLVKLLATLPLLAMPINAPPPAETYYKLDAYIGGRKLLSGNDKETILFRARLAAALLPVLLAAFVFFMTQEMFGTGAGLLALALAVFDPTLLAHGALVTTDTGLSCFLLGAVYMFYRYVKAPSAFRLIAAGVMAGLALASKHSGMFLFLILPALVLCELVRAYTTHQLPSGNFWNRYLKLPATLVIILVISVGTLWAFYGFRYSARPSGLALHPPLRVEVEPLKPREAKAVMAIAHWKLLPESYLFGAADVRRVGEGYASFILGNIHPHGVWFYFPIVLTIKATEALLFLALIALVAVFARRLWATREFIFLAVPSVIFLAVAMSAHLNTGVRHVLPAYVFAWPLFAGAASTLLRGRWARLLVALAILHAASSLATFHTHMAYANLFWGGPSNIHNLLTDSNADWGQQLYQVRDYLAQRNVKDCWFSYIGEFETRFEYWGIPCKPMPNMDALPPDYPAGPAASAYDLIPQEIDGPVLISADELSGYLTGPDPLNPYGDFQKLKPSANIDGGVLVYDGHFSAPKLASLTLRLKVAAALKTDPKRGVEMAREVVALYPENVASWIILGRALQDTQQTADARSAYEQAIHTAQSVQPAFQAKRIPEIQKLLDGLHGN